MEGNCHTHQALSVQSVEQYTKCSLLASSANFGHFLIMSSHIRKDTRLSLLSAHVLQVTESWAGPGNKANVTMFLGHLDFIPQL